MALQTKGRRNGLVGFLVLMPIVFAAGATADDFDQPPINYATSIPQNAISRLQERLESGQVRLEHEEGFGYLRALLDALEVPLSSQTLVFSKTSLQRQHIAPRTPRAVYFSDDMYVGFCRDGDVLELSAVDPSLGTVFYTLDQEKTAEPRFVRQSDSCLLCHGASHQQGVPGHLVRSLYVDAGGLPILSSGSHRIDHTSLLENRWGGWYVTGTHGKQKHLGNLVVYGRENPEQIDNTGGLNLTSLEGRFDTSKYLTGHSDIVALMVLEHQAQAHNLIARANFLTRVALHQEASLNRELGKPQDERWQSTTSRIKDAGEPLVKYLLFCDEAPLNGPISGTSGFAADFSARGPRDAEGRSLRDLDLQRRLFKYPLSYLVYSPEFKALPTEVRDYVWQRIDDVLSERDASEPFRHLTSADRQAIREILTATLERASAEL
jgi:hypothetical protein